MAFLLVICYSQSHSWRLIGLFMTRNTAVHNFLSNLWESCFKNRTTHQLPYCAAQFWFKTQGLKVLLVNSSGQMIVPWMEGFWVPKGSKETIKQVIKEQYFQVSLCYTGIALWPILDLPQVRPPYRFFPLTIK